MIRLSIIKTLLSDGSKTYDVGMYRMDNAQRFVFNAIDEKSAYQFRNNLYNLLRDEKYILTDEIELIG